jgi:mycofactocin system FadH/OYE family oxidoreductase 1
VTVPAPLPALATTVTIGAHEAPSRLVFGPHETNLADGRALSARHVAYYARRAAGGAGVIITETASVTANDWPYERAPLADACGPGWRDLAAACAPHATVVLAGLGHAGGQGSSAYSQEVMWAPSPVADVVSREVPASLGEAEIATLVSAFARAATCAVRSGLHGVELDAGAWSLLRQFHSGLTNQRGDRYGADRLLATREIIAAVRRAIGADHILALRLSCDELAPWAGVTPEIAAETVAVLASSVDLLTVVRAGPYATSAYRPDYHAPAGFNLDLCRQMRAAAGGRVPVVLQGSVVDPAMADWALTDGVCDLVEMTRAQIAAASLLREHVAGRSSPPCILCNQACRVRDPRNPIVSCVIDPLSGFETDAELAPWPGPDIDRARRGSAGGPAGPGAGPPVLVVGGGPAGLEAARVLASGGCTVRLVSSGPLGGALTAAAVGSGRDRLAAATRWLASAVGSAGVEVEVGRAVTASEVNSFVAEGGQVVLATGSRFFEERYAGAGLPVLDPLAVLAEPSVLPDGPVAVIDTVGDWVAVNLAEWLAVAHGRDVTLICPDQVAGTLLARTGDLSDANGRLQRAGVRRALRCLVRTIDAGGVAVEDCWTGAPSRIAASSVVDCGHRLPEESLYLATAGAAASGVVRAGDCIAPRSLLEAVIEGRRAARAILGARAGTPV